MDYVVIEKAKDYEVRLRNYKGDLYKVFISPKANYAFRIKDGLMFTWGKTQEDDPERFPAPNIADIEVTGCCTGLRGDGITCPFCFPAGTLISTTSGYKNIEEIKKNDEIISYSISDSNAALNKVEEVYERDYEEVLITLELENGNKITTTPNHPFYVKNVGWVKACDLTEDSDLLLEEELEEEGY